MSKKIILIGIIVLLCHSCTWKHDGKIVKDKNGNLYKLKASGYRYENYDLEPLSKYDIDSFYLTRKGGNNE